MNEMMDLDSDASTSQAAAAPHALYKRRRMPSIHYLNSRQQWGMNVLNLPLPFASRSRRKLSPTHMASVMVWNPSRLQNMSMAIGPGTPASVVMSAMPASEEHDESDDDETSNVFMARRMQSHSDDDDDDEATEASGNTVADERMQDPGFVRNYIEHGYNDQLDNAGEAQEVESSNDDESSDDNEDVEQNTDEHSVAAAQGADNTTASEQPRLMLYSSRFRFLRANDAALRHEAYRILRRRLREEAEAIAEQGNLNALRVNAAANVDDDEAALNMTPLERVQNRLRARDMAPSIRHGGCINTACWLNVPWRFSTVNEAFGVLRSTVVSSYECPTQLVTSGDDRLLKVWDCAGAMGMDNPLSGGWNTWSPFCMLPPEGDTFKEEWKEYHAQRASHQIGVSGTVRKIKTTSTGHRGNVFHATPLMYDPGKFLTCGADGYLRMIDAVGDKSTIVSHPVLEQDGSEVFRIRSLMAYSHVMLTSNTGLICSERGLHRFDLRLPPRQQQKRSLLEDLIDEESSWRTPACKACAIWSPHGDQLENMESSYVFAGGSSGSVGLFDLRMDASKGRIVQRYRPKALLAGESRVSVSGLDVSKDSRELLVSYESDQIYTFPIMQNGSSIARPTLEDIDITSMHHECSSGHAVTELASYGGHLNRFTFLKNARYAGPNDDYICTGSDSGHAWIYERKSGTVVSLLGADHSTCNGAVPHPSLPFFLTYGIESTAKLWRASCPINSRADDSPVGRQRCMLRRKHELSPVAQNWDGVQSVLRLFESLGEGVFPDCIASSDEVSASGRFGSSSRRGICGVDTPQVGNALLELPSTLRQNQYECLYCFVRDVDVPVEEPVLHFIHHVSISRLRIQADQIGCLWKPWTPYAFIDKSMSDCKLHSSELVPDYPSDWLMFDPKILSHVHCPRKHFARDRNNYIIGNMIPDFFDDVGDGPKDIPWLDKDLVHEYEAAEPMAFSRKLLFDTAWLCKEGGNDAMKSGLLQAAARRYDKAIQYVALVLMEYGGEPEGDIRKLCSPYRKEIAKETAKVEEKKNKKRKSVSSLTWSEPLKLLLMCRLNLALLFLKPETSAPGQAAIQARAALKLLSPFCVAPGKYQVGGEFAEEILEVDEPVKSFAEAKPLQAKAYFRLGSAANETGDYAVAVKSFEASLTASTMIGNMKPDPVTTRVLQTAKHNLKAKKKRAREKYHRMLERDANIRNGSTPSNATLDTNGSTS